MWLLRSDVAQCVASSIGRGVELKQYDLHAWVIMPNHVHLLLTPLVPLSQAIGSLKSASAKAANVVLNTTGQRFWQDESYDHLVRDAAEFRRIWSYIENNPVSAGLASAPQAYAWTSAGRPGRPPQAEGLPHCPDSPE